MENSINQLHFAAAMMPEIFNSANEAKVESRSLGRHLAVRLGHLLVAAGERLQGEGPAGPSVEIQDNPA